MKSSELEQTVDFSIVPEITVTESDLRTLTIYQTDYVTIEHPPDASTLDQMNVVECSGTLEFWNDAEEDILVNYPFTDQPPGNKESNS